MTKWRSKLFHGGNSTFINSLDKRKFSYLEYCRCRDTKSYSVVVVIRILQTHILTLNSFKTAHVLYAFLCSLQALSRLLWRKCKCHGLSGSCTMKSCWMQQPTFRQVGDHLRKKYESASEMVVKLNRRGKERLRLRHNHLKRPSESDLMYYEPSPNYCDPDPSEGSLGTSGRECNMSSSGIDGCELLCCGRGHNIQQVKVTRNCNCIFIWCCQVKCQKCKEIVNKYTCK